MNRWNVEVTDDGRWRITCGQLTLPPLNGTIPVREVLAHVADIEGRPMDWTLTASTSTFVGTPTACVTAGPSRLLLSDDNSVTSDGENLYLRDEGSGDSVVLDRAETRALAAYITALGGAS